MDINLLGPASRYAQRELGGIFTPVPRVIPIGTNVVPVTPVDPNCISVLFVNIGTTNITLGFEPGIVSGSGILLLGNGAFFGLNYKEDADAPSFAVWGVSDLAGGGLYMTKISAASKLAAITA